MTAAVGDIDSPLSLNYYAYVQNNPLKYHDPSGHNPLLIYAAEVATGVAIDYMIAKLTGTKFKFGQSLATNAFMSAAAYAAKAAKLASIISKSKMAQEAIASLKKAVTTLGKKVASEIGVSAKKVVQSAKNTVNKLTKKASSGCNCFAPGTKIQTLTGEKNIEDIKLGDYVLSKNDHTGEVSYQPVTDTFAHETNEIYYVKFGNETIKTTFNHPFWVKGKGWTFAKDLRVGDELETAEGQPLPIESIELKQETTMVYNMTVDEFHTYFVSDLGVWVHNTKCGVSFAGKGATQAKVSKLSRKEAFRQAKQGAGIPKSSQYKTHKYVYDGTSENRTVYKFTVGGKEKYIIEHTEDKMGRGPHFHGADDAKGNPFEKGRYNQYDGHYPEDFNGYKK